MGDCGCGYDRSIDEKKASQLRGRNLLKLIRNIPKKDEKNISDLKDGEEIIIKTQTLPPITLTTEESSRCDEIDQLSVEAQLEKKRLDYLLSRIEELRCGKDL